VVGVEKATRNRSAGKASPPSDSAIGEGGKKWRMMNQ
jgi:hypothetical protein